MECTATREMAVLLRGKIMVKFVDRFEKHKEITKAIYIPKKLHLTVFHDEKYTDNVAKRIVLRELNDSNLRNSVETLSVYSETTFDANSNVCRKIGGKSDKKTGKCKIFATENKIFK